MIVMTVIFAIVTIILVIIGLREVRKSDKL